jgi:hypothetical protein
LDPAGTRLVQDLPYRLSPLVNICRHSLRPFYTRRICSRNYSKKVGTDPTFLLTNHIAKIYFSLRLPEQIRLVAEMGFNSRLSMSGS